MGFTKAVSQLELALGPETAKGLVDMCLKEAGLSAVSSPQDLLLFSQLLAKHGGFIEVVARSLKANALVRGADLSTPTT